MKRLFVLNLFFPLILALIISSFRNHSFISNFLTYGLEHFGFFLFWVIIPWAIYTFPFWIVTSGVLSILAYRRYREGKISFLFAWVSILFVVIPVLLTCFNADFYLDHWS